MSPARFASTTTIEWLGVNLTAFESRLTSTCTMRSGSARTSGSPGSTCTLKATPDAAAMASTFSIACATRSSAREGRSRSMLLPASIFETSRMSLMIRIRRSQLFSATWSRWRCSASGTLPWSSSTSCSEPRIEVNGVRSSWLTTDTNSSLRRSTSLSADTSCSATTAPATSPNGSRKGAEATSIGTRPAAPRSTSTSAPRTVSPPSARASGHCSGGIGAPSREMSVNWRR